jgi:aquaporin Z
MEPMPRRMGAEFIGTFILVLGGTGAAVLASGFVPPATPDAAPGPSINIGLVGVSLAFGLTVVCGAYALGHISGGHFNPAITIGALVARRVEPRAVLPYIVAQVVGALAASGVLYLVANGRDGFELDRGGKTANALASNGFADHSPGLYNAASGFLIEVVMTAIFLIVILGVTSRRAPGGFGPLAIGLSLTLIHLISIPVTNTSVNPARSTGPAVFQGGWALEQLWFFWVAPIIGAIIGAIVYVGLNLDSWTTEMSEVREEPVANS